MEKMAWDGPNWGQEDFLFLLIQTLPTFWAEWNWILRICIFFIFWTPDFYISRSPDFQIPGFPGPRSPNSQVPRFPDFQTLPPAPPPPDELLDPSPTPLPTIPGIKYVARGAIAAISGLMPLLDLQMAQDHCQTLHPGQKGKHKPQRSTAIFVPIQPAETR